VIALARAGLWACPRCGRTFANRNQTHTCAPPADLDVLFERSDAGVRETFDKIVDITSASGPVVVVPERSRIALHVRMSFAAFVPRRNRLDGHVVLPRRLDSNRFHEVTTFSPRNVVHAFRLGSPAEVDADVVAWLVESEAVGEQWHLATSSATPPADLREALLRLECALAERDRDAAPGGDLASLLDDPFLEYGASGRRWDRESTVAAFATAGHRHVSIAGFDVQPVSPDRVIATYEAVTGGVRTRRTSVWDRRAGDWRVRLHVGTAMPDQPA